MADISVETGSGSSTANSYVSVDDADIYHEKHLYATDWTGATESNKEAALMWATRLLDERINWAGYKKVSTGALRWPRYDVWDLDGNLLSSTAIPQFLKDAVSEYARRLLDSDLVDTAGTTGFSEMKVDVIELKIDKYDRAPAIPDSVWAIVRPYGQKIKRMKRMLVRC